MTESNDYADAQEKHQLCHNDHCHNSWPQTVRELAGSWNDFPQQEKLRAGQGENIPREPMAD